MKQYSIHLPQQYATGLRRHLKAGTGASVKPRLKLGRRAVALGLTSLELARIHEESLAATLAASKSKKTLRKRAYIFLSEAHVPVLETRRGAKQRRINVRKSNKALNQRTLELNASNGALQQGKVKCQNVGAAIKRCGAYYARLWKDFLELKGVLRQLAHKALVDERRKISRELRNEVAQTLLGIHVRLLTLKQAPRGSPAILGKDVACTKRLVEESLQSINRFARQLGKRGQP